MPLAFHTLQYLVQIIEDEVVYLGDPARFLICRPDPQAVQRQVPEGKARGSCSPCAVPIQQLDNGTRSPTERQEPLQGVQSARKWSLQKHQKGTHNSTAEATQVGQLDLRR